jgi:hypothetical protein
MYKSALKWARFDPTFSLGLYHSVLTERTQSHFYIVPCPIFILEMPKKWAKPFLPILTSHMKDWMAATNKPDRLVVVDKVADDIRAQHSHVDLNGLQQVSDRYTGFLSSSNV